MISDGVRFPETIFEGDIVRFPETIFGADVVRFPETIFGGDIVRFPETIFEGDVVRFPETIFGGDVVRFPEIISGDNAFRNIIACYSVRVTFHSSHVAKWLVTCAPKPRIPGLSLVTTVVVPLVFGH